MLCKLVNVAQNQTFRNEVTNLISAKEAFNVFRGSKFEKFEKLLSKINDNIIKLSVGGREFKTTLGTLVADQNSMLARMAYNGTPYTYGYVSGIEYSRVENGAFFIDRDPKYFNVVLNFLRTGKVEVNETIDLNFLLEEAKYYGINEMIVIIDKIQKAKKTQENEKKAQENEENRKSEQIIEII